MNCMRELYSAIKENPQAGNQDLMQALDWDSGKVRKYKWKLKRKGYITESKDGFSCDAPFEDDSQAENNFSFKRESYEHLLDICMDRLEGRDLSDNQFALLVQEIRQILSQL